VYWNSEQKEIAWAELKDKVPTPAQSLQKLCEEGFVEIFEKRVFRRFLEGTFPEKEPFQNLTPDQQQVYEQIENSLKEGVYRTFLLNGVTGSGKTEVYLHAVALTLKLGKTSLVLVPEIALTPQLVNRFRSRFGDQVAVLHSGMDDGERFDEWSKIHQGETPIVVGARSAVFAPLQNIGLIVVDEEHDSSYKQGEAPRYHGRDVAVFRGYSAGTTIILGSATPSLESCYNVEKGKFHQLNLLSRVHQAKLPNVTLLNMKNSDRQKGSYFFTTRLVESLRQRLLNKEQSILFLNRRGYATVVQCMECEEAIICKNCSLSLVYHQSIGMLKCHQCEFTLPIPRSCPYCQASKKLKEFGVGTEQIESELKIMFPEARILRMDRDTLHGKHALSRMLDQIRKHEVDIVVGTQLVTKGHDFPNITLVGVILADMSLNIPDFRAGERTFQLLTQVAGRAGRGEKSGEVLIQTYNPNHHSLQYAKEHDFESFSETELKNRLELKFPPFISMVALIFSSTQEKRAEVLSRQFCNNIKAFHDRSSISFSPIEAPVKKIKNRYRWMVILKADHIKILHRVLNQALYQPHPLALRQNDRVSIDVDPYHLM